MEPGSIIFPQLQADHSNQYKITGLPSGGSLLLREKYPTTRNLGFLWFSSHCTARIESLRVVISAKYELRDVSIQALVFQAVGGRSALTTALHPTPTRSIWYNIFITSLQPEPDEAYQLESQRCSLWAEPSCFIADL